MPMRLQLGLNKEKRIRSDRMGLTMIECYHSRRYRPHGISQTPLESFSRALPKFDGVCIMLE